MRRWLDRGLLTVAIAGALGVAGAPSQAAQLGAISEFPTAPGSRPLAIVAGPDYALWFTQIGADRIGRMTTDGVHGNVWFTERGTVAAPGSKVGKIDPSTGAVTDYLVRTGSRPLGIVAGPDGNLWFTEQAGNRVGRISPAGVLLAEYEMPQPNSVPWEPAVGPDGAIWFTQFSGTPWFAETVGNKIGRITTAGVITEFPIPSVDTQPVGVAAGPDGQVWFAENSARSRRASRRPTTLR